MNLDRDLIEKLTRESRLSSEEQARVDAALASNEGLKDLVASLPREEPSMQWRSVLNERLLALDRSPKKPRLAWWKIAAPIGLAASVFGGWFMVDRSAPANPYEEPVSASLESQLVASHVESASALDVGSGSLPSAVVSPAVEDKDNIEWNSHDLEAL